MEERVIKSEGEEVEFLDYPMTCGKLHQMLITLLLQRVQNSGNKRVGCLVQL